MRTNDKLFELTAKQHECFRKLKKAFSDCKRAGLGFYNCYGTMGVYDEKKIITYNDTYDEFAICNHDARNPNEFKLPCNEWADDTHYFHPAKPNK
jgi:hypothetical protein